MRSRREGSVSSARRRRDGSGPSVRCRHEDYAPAARRRRGTIFEQILLVVILGAARFSTFSLIIACLVKTRERFMGIGQVLTMPLFFASNAIYPISMMPGWLRVISHGNPLTYEVDALRSLMLHGVSSSFGIGADLGILFAVTTILVMIGARLYPKVVY